MFQKKKKKDKNPWAANLLWVCVTSVQILLGIEGEKNRKQSRIHSHESKFAIRI